VDYAGSGCIEYRYVSAALLNEFAAARLIPPVIGG
jgi:hypothetical protein